LNLAILNTDVQEFINSNLKSDLTKLILKGSPFNHVSIQEIAEQIVSKQKSELKLPTWYQAKNIYFPNKLNIEQTSSEIAANYKANLLSGKTLIDVTGGLGIDAYYFSKKIQNITHCEINKDLAEIVKHNYQILNVNIETLAIDGLSFLSETSKTFDWIYIDPSRRDEDRNKVFLLKDCIPDVPKNLSLLFQKTTKILIKVSPILDITSTINELQFVKEIHIVAVENDVKELLFILEKNYKQSILVKTINFNKKETQHFNFTFKEDSELSIAAPKKYLYEPNSAILKSGAFNNIASKFKLYKLHPNTHLYTSNKHIWFPGRIFKIEHITSYDNKKIKKIIPSLKANITTRNFHESVANIRKKTGIKDGGSVYLFFTTNNLNENCILICSKLN
jgi:16S rRNA G966 N2-methylase RsmD